MCVVMIPVLLFVCLFFFCFFFVCVCVCVVFCAHVRTRRQETPTTYRWKCIYPQTIEPSTEHEACSCRTQVPLAFFLCPNPLNPHHITAPPTFVRIPKGESDVGDITLRTTTQKKKKRRRAWLSWQPKRRTKRWRNGGLPLFLVRQRKQTSRLVLERSFSFFPFFLVCVCMRGGVPSVLLSRLLVLCLFVSFLTLTVLHAG